jgi:hypothetical protein
LFEIALDNSCDGEKSTMNSWCSRKGSILHYLNKLQMALDLAIRFPTLSHQGHTYRKRMNSVDQRESPVHSYLHQWMAS